MKWVKTFRGWTNGKYNIRQIARLDTKGYLYWIYDAKEAQRVCAEPGKYETAVSFTSLKEAKQYVEHTLGG